MVSDREVLQGKDEAPIAYGYRWIILILYCLVNMSYGIIWVTFAPISDVVGNYFHNGTVIATVSLKRFKLRNTVIIGSLIAALAALVRYIATICYSSVNIAVVYWLMLIGQVIAALGQPMLLNLPPVISGDWFPVKERDFAITIGSMCNSVGNAIGNVIPVMLVSQTHRGDASDEYTVHGMDNLMLTEFILCIVPLVLAVVYFKDAPPTPPSLSTMHKIDAANVNTARVNNESMEQVASGSSAYSVLMAECKLLFRNKHFLLLLTSFSFGMGFLCVFLTLLNQIIMPFGYSNKDAGTFGVVYLLAGLTGAAVSSVIMQRTRAYRVILKIVTFLSMMSSLLFVLMLFDDNYWPLLFSVALLGFFVMPIMPVCMENCVECTYPIAEDVSVGLLMVGENILGLPLIFGLQEILRVRSAGNSHMTPANISLFVILLVCFLVALLYNGEYKRSQKEGDEFAPAVVMQQFNVINYNVVIKEEI